MPTVFENEHGFTIRAEANRRPDGTGGGGEPALPDGFPDRETMAWLQAQSRQSGHGSEILVRGAKDLTKKIIKDFRATHPGIRTTIPPKKVFGFIPWGPARECETLRDHLEAFRDANYIGKAFVDEADGIDALAGAGQSGADDLKRYLKFLYELGVALSVHKRL